MTKNEIKSIILNLQLKQKFSQKLAELTEKFIKF